MFSVSSRHTLVLSDLSQALPVSASDGLTFSRHGDKDKQRSGSIVTSITINSTITIVIMTSNTITSITTTYSNAHYYLHIPLPPSCHHLLCQTQHHPRTSTIVIATSPDCDPQALYFDHLQHYLSPRAHWAGGYQSSAQSTATEEPPGVLLMAMRKCPT